jgi:hypothetical protein
MDKKSRLKNLKKLWLNGTEITDVSLRYITQYLPQVPYMVFVSIPVLKKNNLQI